MATAIEVTDMSNTLLPAEVRFGVETCAALQWGATTMVKLTTAEGTEATGFYCVLRDVDHDVRISIARTNALRRLTDLLNRKERRMERMDCREGFAS